MTANLDRRYQRTVDGHDDVASAVRNEADSSEEVAMNVRMIATSAWIASAVTGILAFQGGADVGAAADGRPGIGLGMASKQEGSPITILATQSTLAEGAYTQVAFRNDAEKEVRAVQFAATVLPIRSPQARLTVISGQPIEWSPSMVKRVA